MPLDDLIGVLREQQANVRADQAAPTGDAVLGAARCPICLEDVQRRGNVLDCPLGHWHATV